MTIVSRYAATTVTTNADGVSNVSPLFFELHTDPDPVWISPSTGDPQRADFVLVGSRRSGVPIECRKITVTVPVGNNSPDLTPDINSISAQISLPGWSPRTDAAAKTITFTPDTGFALISRETGVTIQLMGIRINTVIGSAPLPVTIEWRDHYPDNDNDPWASAITTFDVGKFPPQFRMDNFKAEQLIVDNGDSVKLDWEASGASSLKLLYDAAEINVLDKSTYTVPNLDHTTVFYLRGTVQVGNNTAERTLTTTVTVRIPHLEVANLTVHGQLRVLAEAKVSASALLEADPNYPLEYIVDGRLDTHYLSSLPFELSGATFIQIDRGYSTAPITTIDIFAGDTAGQFRLPSFVLEANVGGGSWDTLTTFGPFQAEYHYTAPRELAYRYVRIWFINQGTVDRIAIRSVLITPAADAVRFTTDSADFNVPVKAHNGIDN
jgi:hypothetical protein